MNSRYNRYFIYVKPIIKNIYVKTYSSLVFSLVAITFFGLFAIRPTIKTIFALRQDISQQSKVLDELIQKSKNLEVGRINYEAIDSDLKQDINNLISDSVEVDRIIESLNNLASENQASISGLQIQPFEVYAASESASLELKEVSFTFNIQGSYQSLMRVLSQVPSNVRLLSIDTLNINKSEEGSLLIMSINAKTFYLR